MGSKTENIMGEIFAVKSSKLLFFFKVPCVRGIRGTLVLFSLGVLVRNPGITPTRWMSILPPQGQGDWINALDTVTESDAGSSFFLFSFTSSYECPLTPPYLFHRENNSCCFIFYRCMPVLGKVVRGMESRKDRGNIPKGWKERRSLST